MTAQTDLDITPAERRRQKVRGSILEAAERVFATDGEAGLSIRRLAEEIDYSPAAIYKYFGSKDDLIDELKEAFFERILAQIDDIRHSEMPFPARARNCISTYIRTALEKPNHYAAAFSGLHGEAPDDAANGPVMTWDDFQTTNKGRAFAYLSEMVREGQEIGHFRMGFDAALAAKSVWAASHGLAMMMTHMPRFPAMLPDSADLGRDDFIAFHADLIIGGLEK